MVLTIYRGALKLVNGKLDVGVSCLSVACEAELKLTQCKAVMSVLSGKAT